VGQTLENHFGNSLNFYDNFNTNPNAKSFNSKIKLFRVNLRGVIDTRFLLFRFMRLLVLASDLSGEPKLGAKDKDFYEAENCSLELFKIARTPLYILFYKDK
jgi:hypothetical protein